MTTATTAGRRALTAAHRSGGSRPPVPTDCPWPRGEGILAAVGFNPHRQQRRTPFDYVMVAAALLVCLGLVIWAVLG